MMEGYSEPWHEETGPDAETEPGSESRLLFDERIDANRVTSSPSYGDDSLALPLEEPPETHGVPLVEVDALIVHKCEAVFVPSPNYQQQQESRTGAFSRVGQRRVFIVFGPEHAGKFTCAVHLGLDLWQGHGREARFCICRRTVRDSLPLVDLARDPDLPANTIYIIENAFKNGVSLIELSHPAYLSATEEALRKNDKNAYLVLTTTLGESHLDELGVPCVSADPKDMEAVFARHFAYHGARGDLRDSPELVELVRQRQRELLKQLHFPFQANRFFIELNELRPGTDESEVMGLAKKIGSIGQGAARPWFKSLSSKNAQLYAMLAALVDGAERPVLEEIYCAAVHRLRETGASDLKDPGDIGFDDILEKVQAEETETHLIRFSSFTFEREANRQIMNYRHRLWSLTGVLCEFIEKYKERDYWELRRVLGAAIGRLGIYQQASLENVLVGLATHEHHGVAATVGYALDELCRAGPEHYDYVLQLLDNWGDSGDPRLMWAAGASVWRIYDGLAKTAHTTDGGNPDSQKAAEALERVRGTLAKLAQNRDRFGMKVHMRAARHIDARDSVLTTEPAQTEGKNIARSTRDHLQKWRAELEGSILHAMRQVSKLHARDIAQELGAWLEAHEGSSLHGLGHRAVRQLFYESSAPGVILYEERHQPLLDLVSPRLFSEEATADVVMRALMTWMRRPEWATGVHSLILRLANRMRDPAAGLLRACLANEWLQSDPETADTVKSLIVRSYVMSGYPMAMPGQLWGAIAMDTPSKPHLIQTYACAARGLFARFGPQLDVSLSRIGQNRKIAASDQFPPVSALQTMYDRPSLLLPLLESLDPSRAAFVVALTSREILDLGDAVSGPWRHRLIVTTVSEREPLSRKLTLVPIEQLATVSGLAALENAVSERLTQALAALTSEEWCQALPEDVRSLVDDIDALASQLGDRVEQLDDLEASDHYRDVARTVMCTVLSLAARGPVRCVEIVRTWLASEQESRQLIGTACAKALFRLYTHGDPVPSVEAHAVLLELAPLLVEREWSAANVVMQAVRRWLVEPEWAERLLACWYNGSNELMQLVDAIPWEERGALAHVLESWLVSEDEEEIPGHIARLVERLRVYVALGARMPLPTFQEGHSYGLIIADASTAEQEVADRLAKLASTVIEGLRQQYSETIHVLLYYLGQDWPVSGLSQVPTTHELSRNLPTRPRLLGPILDAHSEDRTSFVLVLTSGPVLDEADWALHAWKRQIIIYSSDDDGSRSLQPVPGQSEMRNAEAIIGYLVERIGEQSHGSCHLPVLPEVS